MSERFPIPVNSSFKRGRHQMSVWILTDEIITLLSQHMGISKTEAIHLAIVKMAEDILPDSAKDE